MQKKNMIKFKLNNILFFIGLIAAWQLIYFLGAEVFHWWKFYAFPNPLGVMESLIRLFEQGTLGIAVLVSMKRLLEGFLIAIIIGVTIGILITRYRYLSSNLKPLLLGIQALPSICWVPFAILWFGLKEEAIIFVVIMGSVSSVSIAVEDAIKGVPPIYIKAAKTMGAANKDLYMHVIFPAAIPAFIQGIKQAWSFAWRALMSGEVMSATIGLGHTLMMGRDMADINQVMAVMLIIVAIGMIIDKFIFNYIENRVYRKRGMGYECH